MTTTTSTRRAVTRAAVVAAATSLAAVTFASPASADPALERDLQVSGCTGEPCGKPVIIPFTTTSPNVEVNITNIVGNKTECPQINVNPVIDGKQVDVGTVFPLDPGRHTLVVDAVCAAAGKFDHWGAHIVISDIRVTGKPTAQGASTATVTQDVDHFNGPNGTGGTNGFLPAGKTVKVPAPCTPDAWCNLVDPPGSAWGQFLRNN